VRSLQGSIIWISLINTTTSLSIGSTPSSISATVTAMRGARLQKKSGMTMALSPMLGFDETKKVRASSTLIHRSILKRRSSDEPIEEQLARHENVDFVTF
jgi:hypothetical protein